MKVFYLLVNYYTDLHQRVSLNNKKTMSSILLICFYVQLLSVLVQPTYNNQLEMKVIINVFNIFYSLSLIGRPYQNLIQYENFRQYCFLLPLIVIVILQIIFAMSQLQKIRGKKSMQHHFLRNSIIISLQNGLSIWLQIYFFLFNLYFLDLSSLSLIEQINQATPNIGFITLTTICYIIVILFALLNLFCLETLQFPCSPLKFENVAFEDAFSIVVTAISLIFSSLTQDWQHILYRMMNCMNIGIHIRNEVYRVNSGYNFLSLIILSSTFSYCITDFLFYFLQDKKMQIALLLVLSPFWTNILKKIQSSYCVIRIDKKRNLQQIYNNLIILNHLTKYNKTTFALNTFKYISNVLTNEELFQKELELLNTKTLRTEKSKQIFWHKKFVIIKYSQKYITQTLNLIHNFKNNQFYIESKNQYVKVQLSLSYLQGLQLDHLKQTAQQNLHHSLESRNTSLDLMEVSDLIQKKIQSSKLIEQMYQLFAEKYSFYVNVLKNYQNPKVDLFTALYNLTERGLTLKQQLKKQFELQKSSMLQQMLMLINVEFFNNILQAQVVKYSQVIPDVKSDVFEKKEYLIIHLKDDLLNLQLNSYSPKLMELLGYKQKQIVKDIEFEQLIPFEFLQTHQTLVMNFLNQGKCRFFNAQASLFIKGAGNVFYHSTAEIYLQPSIYNEISFYHFVQIIEEQPSVLIVNRDQQILGYTQPLLQLFQQFDLPRLPLFYLQNINLIFQNYSELEIDEEEKYYELICISSNKLMYATIFVKYDINYLFFKVLDQDQQVLEKYKSQKTFQPIMPSINSESMVEIPKNIFDNLNSPLSMDLTKRNNQDTKLLLKSSSMTEQKFYGEKSRDGSEKVSSADKQMAEDDKIIEYDQEKQAPINIEKESSKYTRSVLKNSLYKDKYEKLNEYLNQRKASSFHYLAISFLLVGILANMIFYIINTATCIPKYEQAYADTTILGMKSFFMTPIYDSATSQVTIVSYLKLIKITKEISLETGTEKKKFALAAINQSYVWLKDSFSSELNNQNLEQYFRDNYIDMWQIVNESLVIRNISLKNALYYYLEAQYELSIIDYDAIFSYVPSNGFIYYLSNLVNVDSFFDELNEETLNLVTTKIELMNHDYIDLVLKFGMLNFIFITIAFCYVLKYYYNNKLYFKLLTDLNVMAVQKEMQKLERILGNLQNERSIKDYYYELIDWERQIKIYETPLNQKANQKRVSSNIYHQKKLLIYIYLLAILITMIIPFFILQSLTNTFCLKYEKSSRFVKSLSISSSALTALYDLRELNYMINAGYYFFYFTDEKRLEQNVKVVQLLQELQDFMQELTSMNENDLLCDQNFKNVFESLKSGNLCDYILHFDAQLAEEHCRLIYSGVMQLGLYNTVNEIYNQINTEYQNTNGFEVSLRKQSAVYEEAEIGLIASDAVLYLQEALFNGILSEKNSIVTLHQVIGGLFISLDSIFIIVLLIYLLPYYQVQFQIIKQMILIVPSYQFYLDKTFESNFRIYKIQQT